MYVLTQHSQPVAIFGLVDLPVREPGGQYLFGRGCWSCVRGDLTLVAISAGVGEEGNDARDKQRPKNTMPMPIPAHPHHPMLWSYQNIIVIASNRTTRKLVTHL